MAEIYSDTWNRHYWVSILSIELRVHRTGRGGSRIFFLSEWSLESCIAHRGFIFFCPTTAHKSSNFGKVYMKIQEKCSWTVKVLTNLHLFFMCRLSNSCFSAWSNITLLNFMVFLTTMKLWCSTMLDRYFSLCRNCLIPLMMVMVVQGNKDWGHLLLPIISTSR